MNRKGLAILLALTLSACSGMAAAESSSLPEASQPAPAPPAESPASDSEPAPLEKKPLSLAWELPVTDEPVELLPEEWDIPANPHYPDGECRERVWWAHGKVLRIPWAKGYQSREGDPVQLWEPSPEESHQLWEKHPELAEECGLLCSLLCDEKGDLIYPKPFQNIHLRKDYLSLTGLEYTWLIDYDGNETDTLRFPITKARSMDRLPDGNYLGYFRKLVTTYDQEGNEIARDSTAYQTPMPNGTVLDARWKSRSLVNISLVPFLRDHPDPAVEKKINQALETFFEDDWSEVFFSEFSADCTGKVLHIRQVGRAKGYRAIASDQVSSNIHLNLETGEVYQLGDLFSDEAEARRYDYENILEKNDGYLSEEYVQLMLDGFMEHHGLNFGVTGDNLYYEVWYYLNDTTPLEIPLAEFGECLNREGGFYRALTSSWD